MNYFLWNIYHLAAARICSIPFYTMTTGDENHLKFVRDELFYWDQQFNSQYVSYIETRLFAAHSGGPLLTDDFFERRKTTSNGGRSYKKKIDVHISSHIYRQLCLHHEGFKLLKTESRLEQYAHELKQHRTNCTSANEAQMIKEAFWVLANTASTELGYRWFMEKDLLADFLRFAEECQNLSVRG